MSDSCVVVLMTVLKVGTFDIASTQQILKIQFKSDQSGIGFWLTK